jgi:hypothetical protein
MALEALKSLAVRPQAPADRVVWKPKICNPTNHMRAAGGTAFILPSMVGA